MLLDSNIVIYAAEPEHVSSRLFINTQPSFVSVVSYVEVLGHLGLTEHEKRFFKDFFRSATTLDVSSQIADQAVELRQQRRMSLGDAIIAATALVHDLPLATRNVRDFRWISDLRIVNPLAT